MKVIRADVMGMCFGVRDAIALALEEAAAQPLTILGDLVHNETVLADLRARGIRIAQQAGAVETRTVMITAHGASNTALGRARAQGLIVMEATCPLVHVAHRAVEKLVRDGYHPIVIGQRDHVEVKGLTEDLPDSDGRIRSPLFWQATSFERRTRLPVMAHFASSVGSTCK